MFGHQGTPRTCTGPVPRYYRVVARRTSAHPWLQPRSPSGRSGTVPSTPSTAEVVSVRVARCVWRASTPQRPRHLLTYFASDSISIELRSSTFNSHRRSRTRCSRPRSPSPRRLAQAVQVDTSTIRFASVRRTLRSILGSHRSVAQVRLVSGLLSTNVG